MKPLEKLVLILAGFGIMAVLFVWALVKWG